jgi:2-oxoisovalerate dehydrogenase E1 component beta subunit
MVLMTPVGAGIHGAMYHSHSLDGVATKIPGWKIVLPSNPLDTYGLLISAIKDPNPVLFLYPKALIRVAGEERIPGEPEDPAELARMIDTPLGGDRWGFKPLWPELPDFEIPIGVAKIRRAGEHLTVVSYGRHLPLCVNEANRLAKSHGISAEVIDLRTLVPMDFEAIRASVEKTGRLLVVNEDTEITNFGEHIIRRVIDECFYLLEAPPKLLAGADVPGVGQAWSIEQASVPQAENILEAMLAVATAEA